MFERYCQNTKFEKITQGGKNHRSSADEDYGSPTNYRARQQFAAAGFNPITALTSKISGMDMSDLMICAVFYLLYRESNDTDFLILLAAFIFGMTG